MGGPRQAVIVLQTCNQGVMNLAQDLNELNLTYLTSHEKWRIVTVMQHTQQLFVDGLRTSTDRTQDQLLHASEVLNALKFILRHQEMYGPLVFPKIQTVDIFND